MDVFVTDKILHEMVPIDAIILPVVDTMLPVVVVILSTTFKDPTD